MAQVVWSRRAIADLVAIRSYIQQSRPMAVRRMAQPLTLAAEALAENSRRGRLAGPAGLRELTVIWPYVIRYRASATDVQIVRIKHGAQRR